MADGVTFIPLFIDNDYRSGDVTFEFRNPYTGQVAGIAASATSQDCKDAIESAGRAFVKWEHSPLEQRRDIFLKAADLLESPEFKDVIISAMRAETAMVEEMTVHNIEDAAMFMRKVAGMTNQLKGETFSSTVSGGHVVAQRRAKGVILSIAPWNAPVYLTVRAVGVAILCGNTVVLKCSEYSPWSQSVVARIFHGAGLPSGVLNFISMDSKDAPALTAGMIAHPLVRAINFTGSDRVGRIIAAEAAKYLKPCIFELGGKAAAVVLDDADIAQAARAVVSSGMYHSGQLCMSTERLIVQRAVSEQLIEEVTQLVKGLKAGDPRTDSTAQLSALFTENAAKGVISMMSEAVAEGAQVILGDLQRQGAIVQPHLLTGVTPGMRLWQRESFGPVFGQRISAKH
ncbi:hypothetical protein PHLCEN_2v6043 [Hermanssonia centrifuga]|uniref:Aldehyde dehydrogenase domain-containing protein n=1 Tax=Hermanssonia centrifuga TaxID=98765 RepID=A0A2R6P0N9_9APHY|nr:hypothetical protein PHLCEN_2v6043 [Hermanssonia centrifuga]